ncbi:MAG: undecaprenyl-diphosphatase UppP [Candidatus Firestonebacteria bacterium RIFOXYA2_FULL_40_8]|nr:MAG: undecaprenyl-diphosphatase UppP [Candidatus Firestonebacteria bacterium RIFOXYA2_FULL_40_8]
MTLLESIILGIVQGLTEFLPVSSSGHLVVIQSFFKNFSQPGILFDVTLHLGTALAVVIYFRKRIVEICKNVKLLMLVLVATAVTGVIGVTFKDAFEKMFTDVKLVGAAFIVTALILLFAERVKPGNKTEKEMSWLNALFVGLIQGIAIIPGISRSGSTISAGLFAKLDRKFAAEFSFLLSIPAVVGAAVLQARHITKDDMVNNDIMIYITGLLVAAITGFFCTKLLVNIIQKQKLYYFSIYLLVIGTIVLTVL